MINYNEIASKIPTRELVSIYNNFSGNKIVKFSDRNTAVVRSSKVMAEKAVSLSDIKNMVSDETKKELSTENKSSGRSEYSGKKIYKQVQDNPRREGTIGHKSWELITDGMTYEEYISAGGRNKDLRWDVDRKRIKVK